MFKYLVNFIAFFSMTGCAINETGLVKLRYFENDSVFIISKESWGGYLSTDKTDAGFTLGRSKRIHFYPKIKNFEALSIDGLLIKVQQDQFIEIFDKEIEPISDESIAWITNNQGIMLHTNQFQLGVLLGFEAREVIRLPRDFNGIFNLQSSSDGKFKAYFYEKPK